MALPSDTSISKIEAVITAMDHEVIELQIAGSYETLRWPKNILKRPLAVGEKIMIELEEFITTAQPAAISAGKPAHPFGNPGTQTVQNAPHKQNDQNPQDLRKLLESLIN